MTHTREGLHNLTYEDSTKIKGSNIGSIVDSIVGSIGYYRREPRGKITLERNYRPILDHQEELKAAAGLPPDTKNILRMLLDSAEKELSLVDRVAE